MNTHDLKTDPDKLAAVKSGLKRFEFRLNDRNFAIGDFLHLRGFERRATRYTGDEQMVRVSYILPGDGINMSERYVVMSIDLVPDK